jgi:hypothetical protein
VCSVCSWPMWQVHFLRGSAGGLLDCRTQGLAGRSQPQYPTPTARNYHSAAGPRIRHGSALCSPSCSGSRWGSSSLAASSDRRLAAVL